MNILRNNDSLAKVKNLVRNFLLMLACYFLFFIILSLISLYFPSIDFNKYQQTDLFELLENNPFKFIFLAVIAAPVIEENIFRSLLKPSEESIKLFICAVLYIIGLVLIPEKGHWILRYTLLFTSLFLVYYALGELVPEKFFRKVCFWLYRQYLIIWIAGAIIFGFVHIFNYVDSFQLDLTLFMMIAPRIIAGLFFGKIKLENKGMVWPILMHSMNNSMVILFTLPFTLSYY